MGSPTTRRQASRKFEFGDQRVVTRVGPSANNWRYARTRRFLARESCRFTRPKGPKRANVSAKLIFPRKSLRADSDLFVLLPSQSKSIPAQSKSIPGPCPAPPWEPHKSSPSPLPSAPGYVLAASTAKLLPRTPGSQRRRLSGGAPLALGGDRLLLSVIRVAPQRETSLSSEEKATRRQ